MRSGRENGGSVIEMEASEVVGEDADVDGADGMTVEGGEMLVGVEGAGSVIFRFLFRRPDL